MRYRSVKWELVPVFVLALMATMALAACKPEQSSQHTTAPTAVEQEIIACIEKGANVESQLALIDLCAMPASTLNKKEQGEENLLTAEEAAEREARMTADIDAYFRGGTAALNKKHLENFVTHDQEFNLKESTELLSVTVRAAATDFKYRDFKIEGDNAEVKASLISWIICIEQEENSDDFIVTMIPGQEVPTFHLFNENNKWKVGEISDHRLEFASAGYDHIKGRFATLEEAAQCAKEIDTDAEIATAF